MRLAALAVALLLPLVTAAAEPVATAPAARVRFGIQTPNQQTTWDDILATWKEAESLGFDSAWVYDHFMPIFGDQDAPCLEGWTLLVGARRGDRAACGSACWSPATRTGTRRCSRRWRPRSIT